MSSHAFIALRHLKSRHSFSFISFISYLSIIGLGIGVAVLILTLAILDGFEDKIRQKIISFDGHIRLTGFLGQPLNESDPILDSTLNSIPEIIDRAPYIRHAVMIRHKRETEGAFVEGISSEKAKSVFGTPEMLVKGEFNFDVDSLGYGGIVLGAALAEKIGVSVGDRVILFDMETVGKVGESPQLGQFYVAGLFSTGLREYDETVIYMGLVAAQKLFGYTNQISGEIIKVRDPDEVFRVSNEIDESLGYPYSSFTWKERHYNLFAWLSIQKYPIVLIFALIVLVAVVNIISSLTMIVMEKTRDIGVLRAMGYSRKDISRVFLYEGGIIGGSGVLLGILITLILGFIQIKWGIFRIPEEVYFMRELPILFNPMHFISIGMLGIILALVATLYPAWKASGVQPSEALRYE